MMASIPERKFVGLGTGQELAFPARNTATRHTQTYIVAKTNLEKYGESPVCEIRLRGLPVLQCFVGRARRAFIGHLSGGRILGSIMSAESAMIAGCLSIWLLESSGMGISKG